MLPHRSAGTSRLPAAARELAVPARRSVPDVPARDRVPDAPTCDRGPDGPTRDHVPDVSARDRGPEARARSRLLDGLRGLAIVLVAVSHGWAIWPANATSDLGVFTGILRAGNIAVTVYFVVGGYLLMRSLLGELARTGRIGAWRAIWRRTARLSANVYLLLVAIAVLFVIDLSDPFTREATRDTVPIETPARAATSWIVGRRLRPVTARPDITFTCLSPATDTSCLAGIPCGVFTTRETATENERNQG